MTRARTARTGSSPNVPATSPEIRAIVMAKDETLGDVVRIAPDERALDDATDFARA